MKKLLSLILTVSLFIPYAESAAPTRDNTYTTGQIIEAVDVTANEDVIFTYLQAGVDTYASGSVNSAAIQDSSVDISTDTNLTAGTNISLSGDELNVDDAFLVNNADDNTTGSITASGFYANNGVSGVTVVATGTVSGVVVSASGALQVGSDYISDITGTGLSVSGGALTVTTTGESTTVSDTTTMNLTLTGFDITADGLYTAGDNLTLTGADFDLDASISLTNVTASNTVTGVVVDTQYLDYGGGTSVTVRDNLIVNGTITGTTSLASGDIFVGNASNIATDVAISGDVSITNAGVTAVSDDSHNHTTTTISGVDISADTNLTAGDALTLTDDDIDFDGGATPAGDLGGTWASPSVTDDSHNHTSTSISGIDISADTNLTAGDNLTLTDDDIDLDASISLTNVTASGTVTGIVVDTQYVDNSNGASVTVRDNLTTNGTITSYDLPAIGNDPDIAVAGYIGRDNDDHALRGYDGTNQFVYGQKIVQIDRTIAKPLDLTESATLPIWKNKTPFTFIITAIYSDSDTDNVDFTLKECSAIDFSSLTTIEAITIATDGTAVYYSDLTSGIDHTTIEAGNVVIFDNDATDDPAYVHFLIIGYFDANVN